MCAERFRDDERFRDTFVVAFQTTTTKVRDRLVRTKRPGEAQRDAQEDARAAVGRGVDGPSVVVSRCRPRFDRPPVDGPSARRSAKKQRGRTPAVVFCPPSRRIRRRPICRRVTHDARSVAAQFVTRRTRRIATSLRRRSRGVCALFSRQREEERRWDGAWWRRHTPLALYPRAPRHTTTQLPRLALSFATGYSKWLSGRLLAVVECSRSDGSPNQNVGGTVSVRRLSR